MSKHFVFAVFVLFTAIRAGAWTDGELSVWTTDNRGYRAMAELGKKFEEEMGVPVKVETQEGIKLFGEFTEVEGSYWQMRPMKGQMPKAEFDDRGGRTNGGAAQQNRRAT